MSEHKKNYNEGRKAHSMPLEISRKLELVKDGKKFKSIGDTVQYLLDLESDLQKNGKIVDKYKCKKCGHDAIVTEEMALDLHKFRHRNCKSEENDSKDCDGTLWRTYGLKDKANGTTEQKEKQNEQTDAKDKVTKVRIVDGRKLETIGDWEYIDGKKVVTYIGNDSDKPKTEEDIENDLKNR